MGAFDPSEVNDDELFQDLPPDDPDIENKVDLILARSVVVQSHDGTSQYSHKGVSACGLASFNTVRCVFGLEKDGYAGGDLIRVMLSREFIEDAVGISSLWPSSAHLEVDEIYQFPYFSKALRQVGTIFGEANYQQFMTLLRRLESHCHGGHVSAAIITKPPEILAVIAIRTKVSNPTTFAVFDSHSRPDHHPMGAAFSFFPTAELAADYLATLLSVDPAILADARMQWQTQLLSHFSAHYYIIGNEPPQPLDIEVFKANIKELETKSSLDEAKASLAEMQNRHVKLLAENASLRDEVKVLRSQLSSAEARLRRVEGERNETYLELEQFPPLSKKGKEKEIFDEYTPPPSRQGNSSGISVAWKDHKLPIPNFVSNFFSSDSDDTTTSEKHSSSSRTRKREEKAMEADQLAAAKILSTEQVEIDAEARQAAQNQLLKDAHFALEMQRKFDEEGDVVRDEHFALAASAQKRFDCRICLETCPEDVLTTLFGCQHEFCRECLKGYVSSSLEMMKFPILCPVCVTEAHKGEDGVVNQEVLEILGVTEEDFVKWINFELAKFSTLLDCPKCRKSNLVDRDDHANAEIIACPMPNCVYRWCKKCNQEASSVKEHSCDGTKELDALMKQQGWKKCPGCQTPTEKTIGCNHMTCRAPGCNTHFCYVDGALICTTQNSAAAKDAVDKHYRSCALFDVPPDNQ